MGASAALILATQPAAHQDQVPRSSSAPAATEGLIAADDGVRLYYRVVGDGAQIVLIPGRLFPFHTLQRLAPGRRLIFL